MKNNNFKQKIIISARRIFYYFMLIIDHLPVLNKNNKVLIICYHSVAEDNWRFSIDLETFKKQIYYLSKHYDFITLEDVNDYIQGKMELKRKSIVITFDDGYKDILKIKNYFRQLGITPALFIIADRNNSNRVELDTDRDFLTNKDILELKALGWEIGSHGATHMDLTKADADKLKDEICRSKIRLEQELGFQINYFAYPKGRYSKQILDMVKKAGFKLGFSLKDDFITEKIDPFSIPRIGIDRTHNFIEFKAAFTGSAIQTRKIIRKITNNSI